MARPLRFIHTSDVHLDSTATRGEIAGFRNVAEYAFAKVVEAVIEKECDFFLIVGDLFDHGRIKAHDFDFVKEQIQRLTCPVVLIPGNHDVHDELSLWRRYDPQKLGSHVYPIMDVSGCLVELPELDVEVWGRAMDEHSPEFKPMLGVQASQTDKWSIGMAHGQVVDHNVQTSSSQITHEEIGSCGFDYLALGHVHVWQTYCINDVQACYSGSPVEAFASSKGGYYAQVDLHPQHGVSLEKCRIESPIKQKEPVATHGVFF